VESYPFRYRVILLTEGHNVNLNKLQAVLICYVKKKKSFSSIFSIFFISFSLKFHIDITLYVGNKLQLCMLKDNIKVGEITLYVEV
jgi:hypothetical protein